MILTKYSTANKYSTDNNSSLRYSYNLALMALGSLLSQLSHADVYKTTTSEGQVVYTDNINTAYQYNKNSKNISVLDKLPNIDNDSTRDIHYYNQVDNSKANISVLDNRYPPNHKYLRQRLNPQRHPLA
ncbi:hypothetical protein RPG13_35090 [Mesorhizobium sp. ISC15]